MKCEDCPNHDEFVRGYATCWLLETLVRPDDSCTVTQAEKRDETR